MPKPTDPVIGREIWPLMEYQETYLEGPYDEALNGNLTAEGVVKLLPHMEHMVELIDRALNERGTSGYPRAEFTKMKSTLITMIANFRSAL